MPIHIKTVVEKQRGCGFKKPGGLYLIGGASSSSCCLLPFPLTVCKCCGQGIKFSRGFTWINTNLFAKGNGISRNDHDTVFDCDNCFMAKLNQRMGLMWVGESFYKTPQHFITEAENIGISKRIAAVPRDCEPGKTWIALAHKKCITSFPDGGGDPVMLPGVFMLFKVMSIQYVVKNTDSDKELQKLQDNGIELIKVIQEGQQQTIDI